MYKDFDISAKQRQAIKYAFDPQITELLLGGSAGGAKSWTVCQICAMAALMYPGVRIFIGRKTLQSLKQSTIATLVNKVHPSMGILYSDYVMHYQSMELDYRNGSKIIFGELDYTPSDPEFARKGSLEIDFGVIEEAGEVAEQAFSVVKSRTGRGVMANDYGIPGFIIATCNPSRNFLRQKFYDPYVELGASGFEKWQIGEVEVNGEKVPAYRGFLRMGAYDNPFLPQSYIDNLKTLPDAERKRLLEGNWDYADEDNSLFRSSLMDKATTFELPQNTDTFDKFIGVDVADVGKDKTVFSLMENGVLTVQKTSSTQMDWDKNSKLPMGRLLADELVEFAQRNGFTQHTASHIAVETNGVGASIRDFLRDRGWQITEYTATHKSRSENYYQLMLDMDSGAVKMYHEIQNFDDLRRQLGVHSFTMNNQIPEVIKKDKIKQVLGKSPDAADSFCICNFCRNWVNNPENDPRRNTNRIFF